MKRRLSDVIENVHITATTNKTTNLAPLIAPRRPVKPSLGFSSGA
jgi:hypothetical protein